MLILYSTGCPQCKVLKTKLDAKNIIYEICSDTNKMLEKNFRSLPMLETDDKVMNFNEAIQWVNSING